MARATRRTRPSRQRAAVGASRRAPAPRANLGRRSPARPRARPAPPRLPDPRHPPSRRPTHPTPPQLPTLNTTGMPFSVSASAGGAPPFLAAPPSASSKVAPPKKERTKARGVAVSEVGGRRADEGPVEKPIVWEAAVGAAAAVVGGGGGGTRAGVRAAATVGGCRVVCRGALSGSGDDRRGKQHTPRSAATDPHFTPHHPSPTCRPASSLWAAARAACASRKGWPGWRTSPWSTGEAGAAPCEGARMCRVRSRIERGRRRRAGCARARARGWARPPRARGRARLVPGAAHAPLGTDAAAVAPARAPTAGS